MSLMDTADGAFMSQAYGWAFSNPIRKVYYNITVTSLSVAVALADRHGRAAPGFVEQALLEDGFWGWLDSLDFGTLGYGVVGLFVAHLGGLGHRLEDAPDRGALERARRRHGLSPCR